MERTLRFLKGAFGADRLLGLALLALAVFFYKTDPYPVEFLRLKTFDYYQKAKPRVIPPPQAKPVTIIDLDEVSLAEVGQWPWPRNIIAKLVENLMEMGAVLVAFDMVFAEPDRMNPSEVADSIYGLDEETKQRLRALPGNDKAFSDVIKNSRVVLGQSAFWEDRKIKAGPPVKKSIALRATRKGLDPKDYLNNLPDMIRNIPVIEKGAAGHGLFSLIPEIDGVIRRVPSMFIYNGDIYPALSIEMLRVAFQQRTSVAFADELGITYIGIAPKSKFPPKGLKIPTDNQGRIYPYFSKSDKAKYVSARDVLSGKVDEKMIRGRMTILGTSAVGLRDIRSTPVESDIPGVEIHAQLIESALHGAFLTRPGFVKGAELMLLLVGGLLMIWLAPLLEAKWTMMLFVLVASVAGATSWFLFAGIDLTPYLGWASEWGWIAPGALKLEGRILFDAGFAVISIMILYSALTYASYAKEEAERRQTRDAFSKYLSPAMVEKVAGDPGQLKLGGEKREMTLLFCDVRGFTTISEQFDAVGLTSLINKLLTPLTNVILNNQGTVDKYMGDCIMAFWNAPLDDEDHARNACLSALGMLAEIPPLNDRLEKEAEQEGRKHIPLQVGFGLNSGECVVGNMGSDQRFDYSVLGDSVNLAARLEGQSKNYGVDIVIGPTTKALAADLAIIDLDFIQVKGKTKGVHIHALMGDQKVAEDKAFGALKASVEQMLAAYRAQQWDKAEEQIKVCRGRMGEFRIAGLFDLYEERVAAYRKTPPPPDWDGVFIAITK